MSATSNELAVGTEFAGYRITGVVGRGGMSIVYSAEHVRLGRTVALKVLSPALAADDAFRSRFSRESQLAASLDHPNIIAVYDAGESDGVFYIAMRLVRGDDLGQILERSGPLSLGQTVYLMEQIGGALDQAHAQGLVHRDVKPANILVERPSDRAYLTDFGVVKQTSSGGLTRTGYFLGTFEYAAPEQIEGREIDPRTDEYALGCVLYESLTGEAPFAAETEGSVIHAHLVDPPPKLSTKRPDLPLAIDDVIATAMAKAKEDRYPTCGHLIRALRNASRGGTVASDAAPMAASAPATVLSSPVLPTSEPSTPAAAPTPVAAEASPAAPPASETSAGDGAGRPPARTVELKRRSLVLAAVAVVVLVAAAVAAAVLLTRNDNSTSAPPPATSTPSATTATVAPAAPVAVGLKGVVPTALLKYCTPGTAANGASVTADCTPPTTAANTFWPDSWSFSLYPSTPALLKAYNALRTQSGIGKNFGRCDRTAWAGEGAWLHNPDPGAQPKPGGRRFCYFQGNVAVIVWAHEKLGQASHIDMLGVARASGSDHFNLYGWYSFWHHTVGKCLAPNCEARIK